MVKEPGQTGGREYQGDVPSHQGSRETMAETASTAVEAAKSAATERLEEQKRAASQSIDAFARAVRRASEELSKEDQTVAARLIQEAAGGLEGLSRTLSQKSFGDMLGTVRDFGRRNPIALAGGAALLGLAIGRVARTAADASNGAGAASSSQRSLPAGSEAGGMSGRGGSSTAGEFPASRASASPTSSTSPAPSAALPGSGSRLHEGAKRSGGSS
jgi:hypothetical protein